MEMELSFDQIDDLFDEDFSNEDFGIDDFDNEGFEEEEQIEEEEEIIVKPIPKSILRNSSFKMPHSVVSEIVVKPLINTKL